MKNKNEEILNEFKEMMMGFSAIKNDPPEITTTVVVVTQVMNALWFLHDPKGFTGKESEKIFDIPNSGLNRSETDKLYKEHELLIQVQKHAVTIMNKSLKGKGFEKQIVYLINKIKTLPDRWQEGLIEQMKEYMDSGRTKNNNHSVEAMRTMVDVAKNINGVVEIEILRHKHEDLLN